MATRTMMYAPGIRVVVATRKHGILDVSDDIAAGSLMLNENAPHTFQFNLINHRRKYDGVFTPNDRISVKFKRIAWLQCFAGYLNTVPVFSSVPRTISLSATCTIKRLQMALWDPGADASTQLLQLPDISATDPNGAPALDGGLRERVVKLLVNVAGWDAEKIHMGALPQLWYNKIAKLVDKLSDRINWSATSVLGSGATISGGSIDSIGVRTIASTLPGTGTLRDYEGVATWYDGNKAANTSGGSHGALGISTDPNQNSWYCAFSVPYANRDGSSYLSAAEERAARQWWAGRKLVVLNTVTNKAVVVEAADFETASSMAGSNNHVMDLSPAAFQATGGSLNQGTFQCQIRFAPEGAALGPYTGAIGGGGTGQTVASTPFIGNTSPSTSSTTTPSTGQATVQAILDLAMSKIGTAYRFATPAPTNPNPSSFDCSGFVRWLCAQLGVSGAASWGDSDAIFTACQNNGGLIATDVALKTPGTVIGHWGKGQNGHIALSLGDGRVIEAGGSGSGVAINSASGRNWTVAGILPGVKYAGWVPSAAGIGGQLINGQFTPSPTAESEMFTGLLALINDEPLLQYVDPLVAASQRSWCSAPNGDFIAWFPDYFGAYNTSGVMNVQDIEIMEDFTIGWNDEALKTHVFTSGAPQTNQIGMLPGSEVDANAMAQTGGIATVDLPEVLEAVLGTPKGQSMFDDVFKDAKTIYKRFGARNTFKALPTVGLHEAEFWFALRLFQMSWAQQFSTMIPLTFMPELFPGMLLRFPSMKMQVYVSSVTHHFSLSQGGSFTTNVNVVAPSALDGSGLYGLLPLAGVA